MTADAVLNLSTYRFHPIADPQGLSGPLLEYGHQCGVKGTVLLSEEGLNAFVAGPESGCRDFLTRLRALPGCADLQAKESWSAATPFRKLKVKVKREIIRMDRPAIRPALGRAPSVDAQTLSRWLDTGRDDAGREVVLLDTRNGFEVDVGTFEGALDWRLARFTEFPQALAQHREALQGKTVVTFCTGGIRCEKAALHMAETGVHDVLQLDGGILRYFEQVGARHWNGECFVFDERVSLDPRLSAAADRQD
jgi:UPF0176 protein